MAGGADPGQARTHDEDVHVLSCGRAVGRHREKSMAVSTVTGVVVVTLDALGPQRRISTIRTQALETAPAVAKTMPATIQ